MQKAGGDESTWDCHFPHPFPAHHQENGLWSLSSSCDAASPRKWIRVQGAVLWSLVHATVSGACGSPTPRSLSSRIATGPESHLYTHCLREQPVLPMSSCAKTARHLGSTALSTGRHQCAVDPSEPEDDKKTNTVPTIRAPALTLVLCCMFCCCFTYHLFP